MNGLSGRIIWKTIRFCIEILSVTKKAKMLFSNIFMQKSTSGRRKSSPVRILSFSYCMIMIFSSIRFPNTLQEQQMLVLHFCFLKRQRNLFRLVRVIWLVWGTIRAVWCCILKISRYTLNFAMPRFQISKCFRCHIIWLLFIARKPAWKVLWQKILHFFSFCTLFPKKIWI